MGKDKHENEELIKHAWGEDIWFHVDKLSSAHVYIRLPSSMPDMEAIPEPLLQLSIPASVVGMPSYLTLTACFTDEGTVRNLSKQIPSVSLLGTFGNMSTALKLHIFVDPEGNKRDNLTIIFTPASNLKKTGDMATGQVSFHSDKMVKRVHVSTRVNAIVNRLNKTKIERTTVDLEQEKIEHE